MVFGLLARGIGCLAISIYKKNIDSQDRDPPKSGIVTYEFINYTYTLFSMIQAKTMKLLTIHYVG